MTKKARSETAISAASKGGIERAKKTTPTRRKEIAQGAALVRWAAAKEAPAVAKYGALDRPLRIGDTEIPCFVLADGRRVLAQRGLHIGLKLSEGGGRGGARKLAVLMSYFAEKGIDTRGLSARANNPIRFRFTTPNGGFIADGYEALILPDICAVVLDAATQGKLHARQGHLARQCALLQHGFATVGIIALVDEATGYQDFRARDALAVILEKFIAKELRPWVKTFPVEFYREIYRLNGWEFDADKSARPQVIGHWTNNIVYKRLAPGAKFHGAGQRAALQDAVSQPRCARSRDVRAWGAAESRRGGVAMSFRLSADEQRSVRIALRYLRVRCGSWETLAKALRMQDDSICKVLRGGRSVTPSLAFRVSRLARVSMDKLLTGDFVPPGTCAHCGHPPDAR